MQKFFQQGGISHNAFMHVVAIIVVSASAAREPQPSKTQTTYRPE
jgi:hypothetical protein